MKKAISLFAAMLLLAGGAAAIVLHVPQDYPTIQAAINAAQDYDSVLVAAGTYYEHINYLGKEITVLSASGPETTILDGGTPSGYVVTFSGYENEAVLEGFTITHGYTQQYAGGGILFDTLSRALVTGNIIVDNGEHGGYWNTPGAGISAWHAAPQIKNNVIHSNTCAYYGAAIYLNGCYDVAIEHNVISENYALSGYGQALGGAIYHFNSESQIQWNLFINNDADHPEWGFGGAIAFAGSGVCDIRFNTFSGNISGSGNTGGGICMGPQGNCTTYLHFTNNILVNSSQGGGFAYLYGNPPVEIDFNDVWNNTPFNFYGCNPGPSDLSANPLFEGGSPYSYVLTANSPCVDAGSYAANPDPDGTRPDMGAYPYNRVGVNTAFQPYVFPVVIGPSGGWFAGHLYVTNNTSAPATFDFWTDAVLPDSSVIGPLYLRTNLSFTPGQQIMRSLVQNVPGNAPAGNYLYRVRTGNYQTGEIYGEMALPVTKSGAEGNGGNWAAQVDWNSAGEAAAPIAPLPEAFRLEVSPNPFNPTTALSYELQAASQVSLKIYDIAGRLVTTLVDGQQEAGIHSMTFKGSDLSSGVYLYRLTAGTNTTTGKMVLLK